AARPTNIVSIRTANERGRPGAPVGPLTARRGCGLLRGRLRRGLVVAADGADGRDSQERAEHEQNEKLLHRSILSPEGKQALEKSGVPKDRKSTRLNSSHVAISYAVFCLKKK